MKTIFKTLFLSLAVTTALTSCNKEEEQKFENGYFITVATVAESEDGKNYFKKDNGETIYPTNLQNLADSIVGKRSWFEHRIFKAEYAEQGYDQTAELMSFYPTVKLKDYKTAASSSELAAFGEEIVGLKYAWVSGNNLNLGYEFYASNADKHDFQLVHKTYDDKDGKISLQLCHSETDNSENSRYFTVTSFDISDFMPTTAGAKVKLLISYQIGTDEVRTAEIEVTKDEDTDLLSVS